MRLPVGHFFGQAAHHVKTLALMIVITCATPAHAKIWAFVPHVYEPAKHAPPRWHLRLGVNLGFGGSYADNRSTLAVPVNVDLSLRAWRFLSVVVATTGILSDLDADVCGGRRPHAFVGSAGVRLDRNNHHGDSWFSPFVEAHASVGGQRPLDSCRALAPFGGAGARAGLDVWLGKAAISIALGVEYLPVASAGYFSIGWGRVLRQ
jgi:hypothetical protein